MRKGLAVQLVIICLCALIAALWAAAFPYPSPVVRPFLPPNKRWPTAEIMHWVEARTFDPGFLEFFARDPERVVPKGANLVSPADGLVRTVTFRDGITFLVIALSFWDVHVVRAPVAGVVKDIEQEGLYFTRNESEADIRKSFFLRGKAAPVQQIVTLGTSLGEVRVRLITSYWASRLKVWVHRGQRVDKGQRLGRILLGSTVVLELPGKVDFSVQVGERVKGGESIIAKRSVSP
ncbi:MAG TPA: phosphatidylserine decarboxylase [Rhizomicrobium sp.]|nr:phosphatidylserine decarboxylase [Rhizomicrobium sp.]